MRSVSYTHLVVLALIGLVTAGSVYGTGYGAAADLLSGETQHALPAGFGLAKLAATVASYWACLLYTSRCV